MGYYIDVGINCLYFFTANRLYGFNLLLHALSHLKRRGEIPSGSVGGVPQPLHHVHWSYENHVQLVIQTVSLK